MGDEQNGMDARVKILQSANRLFARQGYENTSLASVAREAKVSKALIFWHFENKECLFDEVIAETIAPYHIEGGDIEHVNALSPDDALEVIAERYTAFVLEHIDSVRFFLSLFLREEKMPDAFFAQVLELYRHFQRLIFENIERGQNEGIFAKELDAHMRASLILSTLNGILVQGLVTIDGSLSATGLVAALRETLIDPMRTS
jgi:AcrR family transcriptional regulator